MAVVLVIFLSKTPYIHSIYGALANPKHMIVEESYYEKTSFASSSESTAHSKQ
jgi:hypothetical protein